MKRSLLKTRLEIIKNKEFIESTICLVANLFAKGEITSFRYGLNQEVKDEKTAEEYLTLEIVDNLANISKWKINKKTKFCYQEFNQHILDTINSKTF